MKRKFLLFILTIAFCALCMASFTSCFKHEHSFVLNSVTPATCQKPECRWYSCECGETSMEYVGEPLEHEWQDATNTEVKICLNCGETYCEVLGHDMSAPTCTKPATCKRGCGYTEGEPLGHTEVIDPAVASTCTQTGLTEGKHCSLCGQVFVAQEIIPMHNYQGGNCIECGETSTEYFVFNLLSNGTYAIEDVNNFGCNW